jgi:Glycosyl transferase family 2
MTDLDRVDPGATIDAVIVTHNSAHLIKGLLQTLLGASGRNGRVIVADNGSTDGTSGIVACFPEAIFVANNNRGFSAACKVGTRYGRSHRIALRQSRCVRHLTAAGLGRPYSHTTWGQCDRLCPCPRLRPTELSGIEIHLPALAASRNRRASSRPSVRRRENHRSLPDPPARTFDSWEARRKSVMRSQRLYTAKHLPVRNAFSTVSSAPCGS